MANNEIQKFDPDKFLPDKNKEVNTDLDYTRKNIYDIIETGMAAIQEYSHVAESSQNPRAYEVLFNALEKLATLNKTLVELSIQKRDEAEPEEDIKKGDTINQNLFVGSTSDLADMIEQMTKKENKKKKE